ncbi:MAG: cupin domain-containing protein [Anaerofustis stercorihominis]|nr:cupin domain-containing protein [Anaerofustis stercorihominis]
MEYVIEQVAQRIQFMREIMEFTYEEMAEHLHVSVEEYIAAEEGRMDFSFTFLYKCAEKFGIDITELMIGETPKLDFYSIIRSGKGLKVKRRSGFEYRHLAYLFKNKIAEPFLVTAPYSEEEQDQPIHLSTHEGQEMDYILSGQLKCCFEDNIEILGPGDCVYYDSSRGHGMIATGGEDCVFIAIVMKE